MKSTETMVSGSKVAKIASISNMAKMKAGLLILESRSNTITSRRENITPLANKLVSITMVMAGRDLISYQ